MSGPTRWLLQLRKFDITIVTLSGLHSQTLSDLLAQFPLKDTNLCMNTLLDEEICFVESNEWRLAFDRSFTHRGSTQEL